MTLDATVHVSIGALDLAVDLMVPAGGTVAVLGPNGAGKSTLLRALAGLVPLHDGRVVLDGELLEDPAAGVRRAPNTRRIGMLFSEGLLFPHLSARDNVAFGLRAAGRSRTAARAAAEEWLRRLDIPDTATLPASALSAGQGQRVALARALAIEPRMLLLDEPMSALDATAREHIIHTLRTHLAAFPGPAVIVTHDPLEAITLAERIVILEGGTTTQQGTVEEVTRRPRSTWAASLVGLNLFTGVADGLAVRLPTGGTLVTATPRHGPVFAVVDPGAVALYREEPVGSPRNIWQAEVSGVERHGDRVRVTLAGTVPIVAVVTPAAVAALDLTTGGTVWAAVKATEVETFPA
jgi:molybdate transport system ATP-binding protein